MKARSMYVLAALLIGIAACGAGAQENVVFSYWYGGGINADLDTLKAHPDFPDNPHGGELLPMLDRPDGGEDYWGARGQAFLTPGTDGDYTFWIASDDDGELWLSTDEDPANATLIAQVEGWCNYQDYAGTSGSRGDNSVSDPITLVAGQRYYIEMLFSDGTGGGHGSIGWSGADIGPDPVTIPGHHFSYDPAWVPAVIFQAKDPSPADGAVDITSPLFEWVAGKDAVSHDVYFGTNPEPGDAEFQVTQPFTMYFHMGVLEPGVTYYWRVDETDAAGTKTVGNVWSFTVMPIKATEPSPPPGVSNAPLSPTLSWKAGNGAVSHDVYLSVVEDAVAAGDPTALLGNVGEAHYHVAGLEVETTYYWRVDEIDATSAKVVGDVWSLTTLGEIENPIVEPNLIGIWTFDTEANDSLVALDMSGNGKHGTVNGAITFETDALMGQVISLPGGDDQFVEIGAVGLSGNDPTTIACWAKADNTSIPDWTLIFGFTTTGGGNGSHFNIGSLGGPGGVGAHVWGWEETIFTDNEALEWHHYAMTYDGTTITYYGDGLEMDTDVDKSNVQDLSIRADNVHIGSRITQTSSFPGDVDDCRIYDRVLTGEEIRALVLDRMAVPVVGPADITSPRDLVVGFPNDGLQDGSGDFGWPGAETPMLAIDNSADRKFLHFKGDIEATGLQITPIVGETIVTGLTLTTANDAPERDPAAYELYGSTDGEAWALIASGEVVDFIQEEAYPRFTMNETPIEFANDVPYMHYQLLFPTVRDPNAANSMQIGEIELIGGTTSQIILSVVRAGGVSGDRDPVGAYGPETAPLTTQPGGLMDGNLVFSDRTYPWAGIPDEYAGTEYIRTFNSDKNGGTLDVTYTVTTSRPALVWITVDDRIPAEWDANGAIASPQDAADYVTAAFAAPGTFVDTEIDIYVREASDGSNDRPMSVYAAELEAGTYVFGSMDSGKNFYTIGAVPLE